MPGDLRVRGSVVVPESELSWRFSRSSGPGGQGVNTTDSRVELSLDLTTTSALSPALRARALERLAGRLDDDGVLTVSASEQRSQWQNRLSAERKLVDALAQAIAPPPRPRVATRPTAGSRQRRLDAKKHRGRLKAMRRADPD
jgi:ribosome-associated protein